MIFASHVVMYVQYVVSESVFTGVCELFWDLEFLELRTSRNLVAFLRDVGHRVTDVSR